MIMIIDTHGNIHNAWLMANGNLIYDDDNKYGIQFRIGMDYTEDQKERFWKIWELKEYLKSSDYQAIKYSEGVISEEEYKPIKEKRKAAREKINELEFDPPTLTREQMDYYEDLVMSKNKKEEG